MAVGITILLSLVVFFLMVEEKLPISEDLPLIGKYYCVTIIEVSLCLVAMCVVLVFVHQQPTPLPPWIEVGTTLPRTEQSEQLRSAPKRVETPRTPAQCCFTQRSCYE